MEVSFRDELEAFRREEQSAQQFFLAYLSLQRIPGSNPSVLNELNESAQFWITVRYALLVAAFVAIGRIFDQDPRSLHNVNKFIQSISANIDDLSRLGLRNRRVAEGSKPEFADEYVSDKYDLTHDDIRDIRKAVLKWRRIYEARYRDIRHLLFAHRGVSHANADDLLARAKIDEMLEMLGFLESLHKSMWELHFNGRRPNLTPTIFDLPPTKNWPDSPGEHVYRQAMDLMYGKIFSLS